MVFFPKYSENFTSWKTRRRNVHTTQCNNQNIDSFSPKNTKPGRKLWLTKSLSVLRLRKWMFNRFHANHCWCVSRLHVLDALAGGFSNLRTFLSEYYCLITHCFIWKHYFVHTGLLKVDRWYQYEFHLVGNAHELTDDPSLM